MGGNTSKPEEKVEEDHSGGFHFLEISLHKNTALILLLALIVVVALIFLLKRLCQRTSGIQRGTNHLTSPYQHASYLPPPPWMYLQPLPQYGPQRFASGNIQELPLPSTATATQTTPASDSPTRSSRNMRDRLFPPRPTTEC